MKIKIAFIVMAAALASCKSNMDDTIAKPAKIPLIGTWKFLAGTIIEKSILS